jgi:hypothetical protein
VKPEAQRLAIAEACGWRKHDKPIDNDCHRYSAPIGTSPFLGRHTLPDYFNDLNAMHEAEKMLTEEQRIAYSDCTYDIALKAQKETGKWRWISLTATQRAEAFLRTLGKWEEAKQ